MFLASALFLGNLWSGEESRGKDNIAKKKSQTQTKAHKTKQQKRKAWKRDKGSSNKRKKKELGIKGASCGMGRGGKDYHQEPPWWFEERHFTAFIPSNYTGTISCYTISDTMKATHVIKNEKERIYLVTWRQHYKISQALQDKVKKSFYLTSWLVEHSFPLWRVALLTINSFWGFQMPQLCFSVFNHLQKLFIALYTSPIVNIIL